MIFGKTLFAQNIEFSYNIFFSESSKIIKKENLKSHIVDTTNKEFIIDYELLNNFGSMKFSKYFPNSTYIYVKGQYFSDVTCLVVDTFLIEDVNNPGLFNQVIDKYMRPMKDGYWFYYNDKGCLVSREKYFRGKLKKRKYY